MKIHHLYSDEDGVSHFGDIEIEWVGGKGSNKLSQKFPATGIIFRETTPDQDSGWHNVSKRQYMIVLDAGVKLTASDGESRIISGGEVILIEDRTGKGHLSKAATDQVRHSIFVTVD